MLSNRLKCVALAVLAAASAANAQVALNPDHLTPVGGVLYFSGTSQATGRELWKTDGSALGTVLVRDLQPGTASSTPHGLKAFAGSLYFGVVTPDMSKAELWKSEGAAGGTVMLQSFARSSNFIRDIMVGVPPVAETNGRLIVAPSESFGPGSSGLTLWATDGTPAGTVSLNQGFCASGCLQETPFSSPVLYNGVVFFGARGGLWKSDGTAGGTALVKEIQTGFSYHVLQSLTVVGPNLFFVAGSTSSGIELWKSDGTASGTGLVKDINLVTHQNSDPVGSSYPLFLTGIGTTVYFSANDEIVGRELWKSDGTASGTLLVKDIRGGADSSSPAYITNVNGTLLFSADDGANGVELWKSDGTAGGTVMVKDIRPGTGSSSPGLGNPNSFSFNPPNTFIQANGSIYFTADDGVGGAELWKSDGTAAGTVMVKDINSGTGSSTPSGFVSFNGLIFFNADDGVHGKDLWRTDGTTAGTIRVAGPPNLTVSDVSINEGNAGTTLAAFTVTLTGAYPDTITVNYATAAGGTGTAGSDYASTQGILTFAPGQTTRTIVVPVMGDATAESDETFMISLSGAANATIIRSQATASITNDDPAPQAALITQWRLYSDVTKEHLYTTDTNEYATLGTRGWTQEGVAYRMLADGGSYLGVFPVPLYRLYNPSSLQHHWTTDWYEATVLSGSVYWNYEGIAGYVLPSAVSGSKPLYRLSFPSPELHLWTTDLNEYQVLQTRGWTAEGLVGHVLP
jgi:ELWxxDGT repeat protein